MSMHAQPVPQMTPSPPRAYRPVPPDAVHAMAGLEDGRVDGPRRNQLLVALPTTLWQRPGPLLEPVDLPLGKVLHHAGSRMSHLVFPTTATVTLLMDMEDGKSAEAAVIGNEGMVGTWVLMGGESANIRAVVQGAGSGWRIRSSDLADDFNRAGPTMHVVLRYTQALIMQIAQNAACHLHHSLEQRLCRWLLRSVDRHDNHQLAATHEGIAELLGVRREGVTEAAGRLRSRGFIQCQRGHITVLNRTGLQRLACECYGVLKKQRERLASDCAP